MALMRVALWIVLGNFLMMPECSKLVNLNDGKRCDTAAFEKSRWNGFFENLRWK